ncbi:hypothetical protein [Pontibacter harenae]|uniref:hypothetical protein n=1 Tax=Pontibacter harenae TaxID=2894083 RepID=UPI001E29C502|nr:hypothetical protein [Pontibacter harenae]MCC9168811.1 hypothetical protein [Pontibacter harenae]
MVSVRLLRKIADTGRDEPGALRYSAVQTPGNSMPYTLVQAAGKSTAERICLQPRKEKYNLLVMGLKGNNPLPSMSLVSVPTEIYNIDIDYRCGWCTQRQ